MKIESVNLSSLLHGTSSAEGGAQSLPKNNANPENFSNALTGQIKLLSVKNGQVELPGQLQTMAKQPSMNNPLDTGDLLKNKGIELLSETNSQAGGLPAQLQTMTMATSPAVNNPLDTGDLLKHKEIELLSDTNSQAVLPGLLQTMTMATPPAINSSNNMGEKELSTLLDKYSPQSDKLKQPEDINKDVNLEATLLGLTGALKSIMPAVTSDQAVIAQNSSGVLALKGLPFIKPSPDEAKLNNPSEESITTVSLQKETVPQPSIQNGLGVNFQSLQNADPAEKTLGIEKHISIEGTEKVVPGITDDLISFHSPIDSKTDSPAITKPLTDPGWSKDLGEQIVWMNNKAMSTAEIKLNPEHLGPISVRIDLNQDQASIIFTAHHAEVKEAIEASIPKLREMLGTQQLNLSNVNISQNSTSDQGRSQSQPFSKTPENREQGIEGVIIDSIDDRVVVNKGLLSIYA